MDVETILSLAALVLITIGWHFLFNFGWWQSLFLAFLWTTLVGGTIGIRGHLNRIAQHLGITQDTDDGARR